MRQNPRLFRLTASVAMTALLTNATLPLAAVAQPAPPPLPAPDQPGASQPQADPPARVGRVAGIKGTVSFHNEGDTQWSPASVNYPVSSGNAFWTEPAATTELEIADSRIVLASSTELDIATLDRAGLQAVAARGEAYLHLRDLSADEAWSVQTPRGLVRLDGAGRYSVVVGSTEQPTLVTVVEGGAAIEGPGVSLHVTSGETATLTGTGSFDASVGPAVNDPFLTANLNAERPRPAPRAPVPAPVAAMPGGADLAGYGDWSPAPQYGQVWYPPVSPGWVPYRQGHWANVAPWGWTWIDDAPWGFAPFHYGRWVELGGRWAWTPGSYAAAEPPVYAPALVAFIGIGAGIAIGAALASHSIGWVPLGPQEQYHPWYHASNSYVQAVNVSNVTTINNNNTVTNNNFANRGAATVVPASAMLASRPVQSVAQPLTPQQFATARPIVGQPLSTAAGGQTPPGGRAMAPGPALAQAPISPRAPGPPGGGFARAASAPTGQSLAGQSSAVHLGASATARPFGGTPPLVAGHGPGTIPSAATPVVAAPQAARPAPSPSAPFAPSPPTRPAEPAAVRPEITSRTPPHEERRGLPQVITPTASAPPHAAAPAAAPRQEQHTPIAAAAAPRLQVPHMEAPHPAPAAPPQRPAATAPPPPAARQAPPPAARAEPPHPPAAQASAQGRPKRPGEP